MSDSSTKREAQYLTSRHWLKLSTIRHPNSGIGSDTTRDKGIIANKTFGGATNAWSKIPLASALRTIQFFIKGGLV